MLQGIVGVLSWVLIVLFVCEIRWKGRVILLSLVALSVVLPYFGDTESAPLYGALGFAMRVALACVYLIKRQLPVVTQ